MTLFVLLLSAAALAAAQTKTVHAVQPASSSSGEAAPGPKGESLRYNINWPSGLSLGEGQLSASFGDGTWSYAFNVEAAVPAFALSESVRSQATAEGCSIELQKTATRGKRKAEETTIFDGAKLKAKRTTKNGGRSDFSISPCAKDALAFLYALRKELAAGRLPPSQKVYYGAAYQVTLKYIGTENIRIGAEAQEADHLTASIKSTGADTAVDLFFARDATRTPLLIQVPFALAKFSMELVR